MRDYGLTPEEQKVLEPIVGLSYGICESQEKFMSLVQLPECGGFPLGWADRLRKAIAKKNPAEYDKLTQEYFDNMREKNLSENLCNYVWNVLVATSRGYGFNASHTLAYSLIALQEMNLAYRFPIVFWNCACLITDSGGSEDDDEPAEERVDIFEKEDFEKYEYIDSPDRTSKIKKKRAKTTDYKKIATAIGKMQQAGIRIEPPNINTSSYTFTPDATNNKILFGLSGMLNVGSDVIEDTIKNRPYSSPKDYVIKVKPKKQAMISLIKGGAFDDMMDRKLCMAWYIWNTCDKKSNITLQNMPSLIKYNLLPERSPEEVMARRVYEFNRYLKAITKADVSAYKEMYTLDERALNFIRELDIEDMITTDNLAWFIRVKDWDKVYQRWMDVFRQWINENKSNILKELNETIFKEDWDKYASGTISAWEMKALSFYYHEHELAHVNRFKYGFSNYFDLPEEPVVERSFTKGGKTINMFKLTKIFGTCIAKDKTKGYVTLLTPEGVVNIKFRKEYFSMFDKQISVIQPDGTKKVVEKSWFERGAMIVVQGMRSGDNFIAKKYASSGGHQLYRITSIDEDGDLELTTQRYQGGIEEDE
jgi:DNA polymerase-3 subunit alpha